MLSIVDESLTNPLERLKCMLFARDPHSLPAANIGDIIRFHRLKVNARNILLPSDCLKAVIIADILTIWSWSSLLFYIIVSKEPCGFIIIRFVAKKQESCAIAKMTARCALYIAALKILESPWLRPRPLVSKIFNGLLLRLSLRMFRPNLKFIALSIPEIIGSIA